MEPPAILRLSELPGVGEHHLAHIVARARSERSPLGHVLDLPPPVLRGCFDLPEAAIAQLVERRLEHESHCCALWQVLVSRGIRALEVSSADYPRVWRERLRPAPPLVYTYGNSAILQREKVGLLASRDLTGESVAALVWLVEQVAREHMAVCTSGMKMTYRIAAAAARAAGIERIVVLDRGILDALQRLPGRDPFGLGPCRRRLDLSKTLVLSPFRPTNPGNPRSGQRRDHLIAALSDVTVAVRARAGGQIEKVCLEALERRQCVLSWNGSDSGLLAAGAFPLDGVSLQDGLRRFLCSP